MGFRLTTLQLTGKDRDTVCRLLGFRPRDKGRSRPLGVDHIFDVAPALCAKLTGYPL